MKYRDIEINNSIFYIKEVLVHFTSTELKILRLLLQYLQKNFQSKIIKTDEVVEDVIKKVKAHIMGIYFYQSAIPDELYELVINEKESFFPDL